MSDGLYDNWCVLVFSTVTCCCVKCVRIQFHPLHMFLKTLKTNTIQTSSPTFSWLPWRWVVVLTVFTYVRTRMTTQLRPFHVIEGFVDQTTHIPSNNWFVCKAVFSCILSSQEKQKMYLFMYVSQDIIIHSLYVLFILFFCSNPSFLQPALSLFLQRDMKQHNGLSNAKT